MKYKIKRKPLERRAVSTSGDEPAWPDLVASNSACTTASRPIQ